MPPLEQFKSIVVLTGAGVSAESGLKTFRDNNGLWENHRVEDVCTPEAFQNNPALVHKFYNTRRQQLLQEAKPNAAHLALANFQKRTSASFTLVTQNVDNLHEQAGSVAVLHMHGELLSARCTVSEKVFPWHTDMDETTPCPCCQSLGSLRPNIVWFGEIPMFMDAIDLALLECDLFVSIGTSGQVYPAAGFVQRAKLSGAHCVELNLEPSAGHPYFDESHNGPASQIVTEYFN